MDSTSIKAMERNSIRFVGNDWFGCDNVLRPIVVRLRITDSGRAIPQPYSWLDNKPHAIAVYASWPALPSAHATLATRRPATAGLSPVGLHQLSLAPSEIQASTVI